MNNEMPATSGCLLWVIGAFLFLVVVIVVAVLTSGGTSDCYSTNGAESGSAQNQRDIQRCINQ